MIWPWGYIKGLFRQGVRAEFGEEDIWAEGWVWSYRMGPRRWRGCAWLVGGGGRGRLKGVRGNWAHPYPHTSVPSQLFPSGGLCAQGSDKEGAQREENEALSLSAWVYTDWPVPWPPDHPRWFFFPNENQWQYNDKVENILCLMCVCLK